jgi:hypothetical protein
MRLGDFRRVLRARPAQGDDRADHRSIVARFCPQGKSGRDQFPSERRAAQKNRSAKTDDCEDLPIAADLFSR